MPPQHSRPEGAQQTLREAVSEAKKRRDDAVAEAERSFWTRIAELKSSYRGATTDMEPILGVTRDAILKAVKKHTGEKPTP
ncbi:hypothetical protein GCM10022403_084180 [Streptomyces coacervatus]|uniref:Uncharacterized protein n=1 Tax=Streptomyces coacervatus TaxID=647381 RepID=A0ABP7JAY1_9ACTN|nr:hypothetical protein [Streptomyces coacervatus]MDF2273366.1 hypothetical protein [Streptomyces coacervatus]